MTGGQREYRRMSEAIFGELCWKCHFLLVCEISALYNAHLEVLVFLKDGSRRILAKPG